MDEAPGWFQAYAAEQAARHLEVMSALFNFNSVIYNRACFRDDADIQPLRGVDGKCPELFPVTKGDLLALSAKTCDALLAAYGLPIDGTLTAKRKRLAIHCGIDQLQ